MTAQARKRRLGVAVGGEMAVKRFVAFASGTRVEHVMMVSGVQKVVAGVRKRTRRTGGRAEARVQRQRGEHGEQRARREQRGSDTSDDDRQAADAQRQLRQRVEQRGEQRRARSRSGQREEREGERRDEQHVGGFRLTRRGDNNSERRSDDGANGGLGHPGGDESGGSGGWGAGGLGDRRGVG